MNRIATSAISAMSSTELLAFYNAATGQSVKKFATKKIGLARTLKANESLPEAPKPKTVDHGPSNKRIAKVLAEDAAVDKLANKKIVEFLKAADGSVTEKLRSAIEKFSGASRKEFFHSAEVAGLNKSTAKNIYRQAKAQ